MSQKRLIFNDQKYNALNFTPSFENSTVGAGILIMLAKKSNVFTAFDRDLMARRSKSMDK